jgi:hypothetical protein
MEAVTPGSGRSGICAGNDAASGLRPTHSLSTQVRRQRTEGANAVYMFLRALVEQGASRPTRYTLPCCRRATEPPVASATDRATLYSTSACRKGGNARPHNRIVFQA